MMLKRDAVTDATRVRSEDDVLKEAADKLVKAHHFSAFKLNCIACRSNVFSSKVKAWFGREEAA
jgi:hypothetical protein